MPGEIIYNIRGVPQMIKHLLRAVAVFNAEYNGAFFAIGGGFFRVFARRLKGPGIKIKRRAKAQKKDAKAQIGLLSIPGIARAAGFSGVVISPRWLRGKLMRIRTSNPVMVTREHGETIRAKGAKGLAVRVLTEQQRDAYVGSWIRSRRSGGAVHEVSQRKVPFILRKRQVVMPAKLGFYASWAGYSGQVSERLEKAAVRAVRRINRHKEVEANVERAAA